MAKKNVKNGPDPINVKDSLSMIELGLHPKYREVPDFSKTPEEKAKLRSLKRQLGRGFYNQKWSSHKLPYIPVYDTLIIYTNKNTKSVKCGQADISDILYRIKKSGEEILKYRWNGSIYKFGELPFWGKSIKKRA